MKKSTWSQRKGEIEALNREREELETRLLFMEVKCMMSNRTGEVIEMNCTEMGSRAAAIRSKRGTEAAEDENKWLKKRVQNFMQQCEAFRMTLESTECQKSGFVHGTMVPEAALRVERVTGHTLRFSDD